MTKSRSCISGKRLAWLLTLLYCASYVTRINYAASLQAIITATGFPKSELAVVAVCMSVTYGVGQTINGWLGDRIKPQNLLLCGLLLSSFINMIFPLVDAWLPRDAVVPTMAVLWTINGFAQAMMWPPIVKILVATMDSASYNYAVVRISWGSSFGTILIYLLAPLIISLTSWRWVFFSCAMFGAIVALLWGVLRSRVGCDGKDVEDVLTNTQTAECKSLARLPRTVILPLLVIVIAIVMMGMLRDGVTNWTPTYLAEVFEFNDTMSIFCTVSLAIFSIVSFSAAAWLYRRFFKNEVFCSGVIFAVAMLSALLMFFCYDGGWLIAVTAMMLITGCMHGINLMLITHVPKRFKKYGNVSTLSGVLNSCTYVGASLSTYAVALLSERVGWRNTVGVWALIAMLGLLCCVLVSRPWRKMINE